MGKKYFDTKAETLESSILGVWAEAAKKQEGLNAVNPKALKKKFDDRKDKDIDNDGDVDDSDEYLHNRRQTVSKAVKNKVKDEGNAFGMALKAAKDKGEKTFVVSGKTYPVKEGLDEGKLGDQWQKGAKSVKSGSFELIRGKSGVHDIMKSGKKIGTFSYDDEGDNFVANMKGERGQLVGNDIDTLISNFKEEADLDEGLGVAEDIPAMEIGTDRYREYAVGLTPGENAEFAAAQDFKVASMKEALAKVWGLDEKKLDKASKEAYDEEDEQLKPVKGSKTMTGGKIAKVDTKPKID